MSNYLRANQLKDAIDNWLIPLRNWDTVQNTYIDQYPICFIKVPYKLFPDRMPSISYLLLSRFPGTVLLDWRVLKDYECKSSLYMRIESAEEDMIAWDKFYDYIMPSVQGCPVSMVKNALRNACIEFCEKTLIWKQDSILNDVEAGYDMYVFAPPKDAKVVMPYRVTFNGVEVQPTDLQSLESFMPNWKDLKEETPKYYFLAFDDIVRLVGTPIKSFSNALSADVALKPSREAEKCPEFIFNDWAETIAAGALSRLHAMAGKIWANPELVNYYSKIFREGISRARSKSAKSWLQESKTMLPVNFYNEKRYF